MTILLRLRQHVVGAAVLLHQETSSQLHPVKLHLTRALNELDALEITLQAKDEQVQYIRNELKKEYVYLHL